jgi:hypothetical protein
MIGVISRADQTEAVEEFFELFKTPWEPFRPGERYDVVLATADEIPELETGLLVVYGAAEKEIDARLGIKACTRVPGAQVRACDWEFPVYGDLLTFAEGGGWSVFATAGSGKVGLSVFQAGASVVRLGYDLFDEVRLLLSLGQPAESAQWPTLELHIVLLRECLLAAGVAFLEIPPVPAGHDFVVCLTHDIDFASIRNHWFDHTIGGFLYRATVGSLLRFLRGRATLRHLWKNWMAAASLPLVYLGWAKDFWEPFGWYLKVEAGLPATYFLIPFKQRPGEFVPEHSARRGAAYEVDDLRPLLALLRQHGCEIGVHGIDAWHSVEKGREEAAKIGKIAGAAAAGIRIHWLLRNAETCSVLERAGYSYDSTYGYNETAGYLNGTSQAFRPLGGNALLELPLLIQDGALFGQDRLDLPEAEAQRRCQALIENSREFGGVLTLLWHDRSHAPERLWGDFYAALVQGLRARGVWFATAAQAVRWFRGRRNVRFDGAPAKARVMNTSLCYEGEEIVPALRIRVYRPSGCGSGALSSDPGKLNYVDVSWNGGALGELNPLGGEAAN